MNQQFYKNMALWVVLLLMILLLVTVLRQGQAAPAEISFTEFLTKLDSDQVESVTSEEGHLTGEYLDGNSFATYVPPIYDTLVPRLEEKGIDYESVHIVEKPPSKTALRKLWKKSGLPLKKLFNTSGGAYREGKWGDKLKSGEVSDAQALEALAANGMLIKRPLVDAGETGLVGFKVDQWEEALG